MSKKELCAAIRNIVMDKNLDVEVKYSMTKAQLEAKYAEVQAAPAQLATDAELDAYMQGSATTVEEAIAEAASVVAEQPAEYNNIPCEKGPAPTPGAPIEEVREKHLLFTFNDVLKFKGSIKTPATVETAVAEEETNKTNNTKEETKMTKIKGLFTFKKKEAVTTADVKKESTIWGSIKSGAKKVWNFIKENKGNIVIGAVSTLVGGIVTSTAVGAVVAGAAIAAAYIVAKEFISKKKAGNVDYKALLNKVALAAGTAIALPFALYAGAVVGIYATAYGFILPYAVIVA